MEPTSSRGCGRFKAIENFLRRIAFNLGNSPSQTEVKIISCIPIDVSDLQHKITCLEAELCKAKEELACKRNVTACCEGSPTRPYFLKINSPLTDTQNQEYFNDKYLDNINNTNTDEEIPICQKEAMNVSNRYSSKSSNNSLSKAKHSKKNTLAYFAIPHHNSPFINKVLANKVKSKHHKERSSKRHLSNKICDNLLSDKMSLPECRDVVAPTSEAPFPYESDTCSCCNESYHKHKDKTKGLPEHGTLRKDKNNTPGEQTYNTNKRSERKHSRSKHKEPTIEDHLQVQAKSTNGRQSSRNGKLVYKTHSKRYKEISSHESSVSKIEVLYSTMLKEHTKSYKTGNSRSIKPNDYSKHYQETQAEKPIIKQNEETFSKIKRVLQNVPTEGKAKAMHKEGTVRSDALVKPRAQGLGRGQAQNKDRWPVFHHKYS